MAMRDEEDDFGHMDNTRDSDGLISGSPRAQDGGKEKDEGMPFCGCLSMKYYQPFFDVDTKDITERIQASMFYCKANSSFISSVAEKPDLYGPFWITTSLVFTAAVCSHMSSWLQSWMNASAWEYDLQSMVNAASVVYGYAGLSPVLAYLGLGQLGVEVKFITLICLYGYSLCVFIMASLVCLTPSNTAIWLALLGAGAWSSVRALAACFHPCG